jgi:murein DD-endopeptidase MepM/ murein hydrolase activator NlpD
VALTPRPPRVLGLIPLRGLPLFCCVVVAGLGIHTSASLSRQADPVQTAVQAFAARQAGTATVGAAAAGLAEAVQVTVRRNDTLDQIFRRLRLSLNDLANIRALDGARQALDRIRPGDILTIFKRDGQLVGLQRPLSIDRTLNVQRDAADNFTASVEQVPLVRHLVTTSGRIDSSLFAAGSAAGLRDATIMELADIFRWDVDFVLDLRVGDSFTLVYEQIEKDGKVVDDGDILAAEFVNAGARYRAIRYVNADGQADYYTPEGVSLRKAFLKAPVKFSRISSVFNLHRRHPILNTIRAHKGVDYAAPTGTPIQAAGAGRIRFRGRKGGFGNMVEITHANGIVTRYGHMSRFASGERVGQHVEQGQVIGYVGMTGLATGPHLHFEFIEHGVSVDPQKALRRSEPGPPIPANQGAMFELIAAPLLTRLDASPVPPPQTSAALAAL